MKPRKLHVAGALIIIAWLASLGWLVRREYFGGTPGEVSASARVAPGAVFFAVYDHVFRRRDEAVLDAAVAA